jgi:REP element-mobilizing transposase RayT
MKMDLPKRKTTRLKNYDYNQNGAYFITICTKGKQKNLCNIVGTGVPDGPITELKQCGIIANKYIENMRNFYSYISIEKYVIMPNHIHFILNIHNVNESGPSGTPVPTNSYIAKFISTYKRFCNKEIGENIWQYRSYDHIIRDYDDYLKIWNYIDTNPAKWQEDCFYSE